MGIVHEHSVIPMSANKCNLGKTEPAFKQPSNCFMSEVVKAEVADASAPGKASPGLTKGADRERKDRILGWAVHRLEYAERFIVEGDRARKSVFGLSDFCKALRKIDIFRFKRKYFPATHCRLEGEADYG